MPIMAVVDRSDARASARVLAQTAKRCIDGELEARTHRVELVNMFRLLNGFKAHGFTGYEYETRSPRGPEALTLAPTSDRHVVDLRKALESAMTETFDGLNLNQAIEQIDLVIRRVAQSQNPETASKEKASRFLELFINRLKAI